MKYMYGSYEQQSKRIDRPTIMKDYKNNKPVEPSQIKEMIGAGLAFIVTMALLAGVLAVWSVA